MEDVDHAKKKTSLSAQEISQKNFATIFDLIKLRYISYMYVWSFTCAQIENTSI